MSSFLCRVNAHIGSLTYNKRLVNIARTLHVAGILRWCEYQVRGRKIRLPVSGGELTITASNAKEFRELQGFYRSDWKEVDFLQALERMLRSGGVCYDIGSNLGQFILPLAHIVGSHGKVIGFEPSPANYATLTAKVHSRKLSNVRLYQLALSDYTGKASLVGSESGASILDDAVGKAVDSPAIPVKVMRGDDLRLAEALPIPKAVKIDVEGAEYGVLLGLKETLSEATCKLLCLEVHPYLAPPGISNEMVVSLVRSFNFTRIEFLNRGDVIHLIAGKAAS